MQHEKITPTVATKWFHSREWAQGLKLVAHKSTDAMEFHFQYAKNRENWNQALAWLSDADLEKLPAGKHEISGDQVYALVSEGPTKELEGTKWEAHLKYIDIQYVVSGKEKIGVAPLSKALAIEPFNTEKDIGFFEIPEPDCRYFLAEPGTFFIFFPQDAHRPGIRVKGNDTDKKIVIKIRVR